MALRARPADRLDGPPVGSSMPGGSSVPGPVPDDPGLSSGGDAVAALVALAREGDADAFAAIYDLFAVRIYRFLRTRVQEPRDAEDLLQTTFLRAVEALPRWEDRGIPFGAWLFRVARNLAIDHARGRRPHADIADAWTLEAPGADPGESATILEASVLATALAGLTPDQRDVIALRFFGDLNGPEIARAMGRDPSAVRALESRALAAMRRSIERGTPTGWNRARERVQRGAAIVPLESRP